MAVVGSGPAGLTAAYHLALFGYGVTLYEGGSDLGGLLRTGIPEFRLPHHVLDKEVDRILDLGVEAVTGVFVNRERLLTIARNHDAVLVATGLQELRALRLGVGEDHLVVQGIDFLDQVRAGVKIRLEGAITTVSTLLMPAGTGGAVEATSPNKAFAMALETGVADEHIEAILFKPVVT